MKTLLVMLLLTGSMLVYSQTTEVLGRDVFLKYKCETCHASTTQQIVSKKANASDISKTTLTEVSNVKTFLKKETELNGKKHPLPFKGTEEELDKISKWIIENKTK